MQISYAYTMLSDQNRRAHYDKYGTMEGFDEDISDMASFIDDLLNIFDDFDDFINILEKGNDKETRTLFRELSQNDRPGAGNRNKKTNMKNKKKQDSFVEMGIEIDKARGDSIDEMMGIMMGK